MSPAVYAGETFADGDVIVHCNSILSGFGDKLILFSQFADVSQTLSIPSAVTTRVTIAADTRTTIGGDTRVTK
jgi:hypothetical protein